MRQRYLLAAGAFRPSGAEVDFEYRVKDVRGRPAYTVAIERADVLDAGQTQTREQVLRATMIFRFEKREWKIVYRHADMMVDLELVLCGGGGDGPGLASRLGAGRIFFGAHVSIPSLHRHRRRDPGLPQPS